MFPLYEVCINEYYLKNLTVSNQHVTSVQSCPSFTTQPESNYPRCHDDDSFFSSVAP